MGLLVRRISGTPGQRGAKLCIGLYIGLYIGLCIGFCIGFYIGFYIGVSGIVYRILYRSLSDPISDPISDPVSDPVSDSVSEFIGVYRALYRTLYRTLYLYLHRPLVIGCSCSLIADADGSWPMAHAGLLPSGWLSPARYFWLERHPSVLFGKVLLGGRRAHC